MADNSFYQFILNWWSSLDGITRTYWIIAIPSTLIFLLQMLLLFFGFDADDMGDGEFDIDADVDSGLNLFSVRNLVIFLTVFSWSGISFSESGMATGVIMAISFIIALAVMLLVAWMFKKISTLGESGNFKISKAVGCVGTVYIPIPAKGKGKVQAKVDGRLVELDAVSDLEEDLATGAMVEITEVINKQFVKVKIQ
jgi:membrane protein implicated in regulation of membrane protease activity